VILKVLRLPGLFLRLICEDLFCLTFVQKKPGCVLVVKIDAIGDFVVYLGFIELLRRHFHSRHLYLVCDQVVANIASSSGCFDAVISINSRKFKFDWFYRLKILRNIRQLGCQCAIQPTYSRRFLLGESIIRCSGARHRIGSCGDLSNMSLLEKWLADRWYTSCYLPPLRRLRSWSIIWNFSTIWGSKIHPSN